MSAVLNSSVRGEIVRISGLEKKRWSNMLENDNSDLTFEFSQIPSHKQTNSNSKTKNNGWYVRKYLGDELSSWLQIMSVENQTTDNWDSQNWDTVK